MRVKSKIVIGNGLLACVSIAVLAYHASLVQQLLALDAELLDKQSRSAALGIDLLRQVDLVGEIVAAQRESPSPVLERRLAAEYTAFHERLLQIDALELATEERDAFDAVQRLWLERMLGRRSSPAAAGADFAGQEAFAQELRRRVRALNLATQRVIESRIQQSSATSERLRTVMWGGIVALAVVSIVLVSATLRSIIEPLQRLLAGTQAVAAGEYHHLLDASKGDEFASVAESFNAMVRRLEQLDQTKKDLIANVSHELKSPLAAMLETNKLLLDELPGPVNERQRKLLNLNVDSGARLSTLISKMLDLSQMEAGGLDLELKVHDFSALLKVVLDELEPRRREKKIQLELEADSRPLWLPCDAERIVQTVENLVENAYKYSPRRGRVSVLVSVAHGPPGDLPSGRRVTLRSSDRDFVLLSVRDHGPGVPDEHKERIFEKFHQLDGRAKKGGVGLGLAICHEIVSAHGGAVWVVDPPSGPGSLFRLLLPRQSQASA